jgi:hypothetical protein
VISGFAEVMILVIDRRQQGLFFLRRAPKEDRRSKKRELHYTTSVSLHQHH